MKLERRGHKVEYGLLVVTSEQVEIATEFRCQFLLVIIRCVSWQRKRRPNGADCREEIEDHFVRIRVECRKLFS